MTAFDNSIAPIAPVIKGKFRARLAASAADVEAAQRLRHQMFVGDAAGNGLDADRFDPKCQHVLVEERDTGRLQACFRFLHIDSGADIDISYSAQFYDLSNLHGYRQPMLEIGRFCVADGADDPTILRLGWAVLTRYVDAHGIAMMFGCSSFPGNDPAPFAPALQLLAQRHLAPAELAPRRGAAETFDFATSLGAQPPSLQAANGVMPSLLRTYLAMGGWVSDHAVIDRELGTFHVFTGVEIAKIPPRRAELLRADAA